MSDASIPRRPDPRHGEHVEQDEPDTDVVPGDDAFAGDDDRTNTARRDRDDAILSPEDAARIMPPD